MSSALAEVGVGGQLDRIDEHRVLFRERGQDLLHHLVDVAMEAEVLARATPMRAPLSPSGSRNCV